MESTKKNVQTTTCGNVRLAKGRETLKTKIVGAIRDGRVAGHALMVGTRPRSKGHVFELNARWMVRPSAARPFAHQEFAAVTTNKAIVIRIKLFPSRQR